MRRGYGRERKWGASLDDQRASHAAAGIEVTGTHPPVYLDLLKPAKKSAAALPQRALAIKSLRPGDELVVHDAAMLGLDATDILMALAEIGKRGAKLLVWTPEPREYHWHPDAAEIVRMASDAEATIKSEKYKRAAAKHLGAPAKWVGDVPRVAAEAWADPTLTAPQAAARVQEVTGVKVSERLMWSKLGLKSKAEGSL